ncbi:MULTISPECIES: hypothetical protein [Pseudoalteromonas]|uniref:Uncharacterized protein n=1 Tax=Pseudoalteromonas rubra TaxID=43658 RepID=A0A0L0EKN4_9GAMM|nr:MULTISPECIES: hypothetical protein [Pseudoalteromonas]ALU44079.1 hypothetical protein AT705_14675 [Pseudoalteromonas rubra]KNC65017.1 hypothetical protein AC626_25805 [Pseudoalteromonas rubra]KNC68849.1 hypothetical protein AC626_02520 [Pseudoalteromonas rubra]MCG7561948.1 hypothetical protein [Pseudoalteromonas sp. McH1-42]MDK1311963.1 hypothetical protein [Pseudoalteromonas sp. R96]
MVQLSIILLLIYVVIAVQCYRSASHKGYPKLFFTLLGLVPYFNLVVWVYLLFLPDLKSSRQLGSLES